MPTKRSHILKQTLNKVCLSMCDLLVDTRRTKGLKELNWYQFFREFHYKLSFDILNCYIVVLNLIYLNCLIVFDHFVGLALKGLRFKSDFPHVYFRMISFKVISQTLCTFLLCESTLNKDAITLFVR